MFYKLSDVESKEQQIFCFRAIGIKHESLFNNYAQLCVRNLMFNLVLRRTAPTDG